MLRCRTKPNATALYPANGLIMSVRENVHLIRKFWQAAPNHHKISHCCRRCYDTARASFICEDSFNFFPIPNPPRQGPGTLGERTGADLFVLYINEHIPPQSVRVCFPSAITNSARLLDLRQGKGRGGTRREQQKNDQTNETKACAYIFAIFLLRSAPDQNHYDMLFCFALGRVTRFLCFMSVSVSVCVCASWTIRLCYTGYTQA